jgi:hypothetical protein
VGIRERINASLTDIRTRGQRLVQLNLELLQAELKAKGQKYGAAIGMFAGAAFLALYAFGFLLATIVVAIHLALPLWLSMLIVTVALFLIIAILVLVGRGRIRKAKSPAPERAIAEAKTTADLFKTSLRDTAQRVKPKPTPAEQVAADAKAAEAKWPGAAPRTTAAAKPAEVPQAAGSTTPSPATPPATPESPSVPTDAPATPSAAPDLPQTDTPAPPADEAKD